MNKYPQSIMKEIRATAPYIFSITKLLFSPGKGQPRFHLYSGKKFLQTMP